MRHILSRRSMLLAALAFPLSLVVTRTAAASAERVSPSVWLADLERSTGGRLGLAAYDSGSRAYVTYRADERFPLCSTAKLMAAGAILKQSETKPELLHQTVRYTAKDLAPHSPVTAKNIAKGLTIAELCAASLQYSDNAAFNLLLGQLGGPAAVTAFARSIGDTAFRLDRWETVLNSATPGDVRDTTTPAAMERSLRKLVLEEGLAPDHRALLQEWLRGNTTGAERIQAGLPQDWVVGDKTGGGFYGTTNDIAVAWPPSRPPVCIAIYFTQKKKDAPTRSDVIAKAAKIATEAWR